MKTPLGEYLSSLDKKQLHIAETEKYAHVTFFFNGGREQPYEGEERILVASPKVATYDLKPEMSAYEVKDKLVEAIKEEKYDFIVVNYANGDMVGHTGVYEAICKAVKAVDECVKDTVEAAKEAGYEVIIIADHGNADNAINADGTPNTAHSLNPVPCIYVTDRAGATVADGKLADVAPTMLKIMGLEQPKEMTGHAPHRLTGRASIYHTLHLTSQMESIKQLYKIGHGPSSSHTMGPLKAAQEFRSQLSGGRIL